jgi:hypothetical protein
VDVRERDTASGRAQLQAQKNVVLLFFFLYMLPETSSMTYLWYKVYMGVKFFEKSRYGQRHTSPQRSSAPASIFISLEQVVTYIVGNALSIVAALGTPTNCSKKLIPQCMDHVRRHQDLRMLEKDGTRSKMRERDDTSKMHEVPPLPGYGTASMRCRAAGI